jgi:hypothetical protein
MVVTIYLMEELHTDSIDGGHEASYGARSRARERAYSNNIKSGYRYQGGVSMSYKRLLSIRPRTSLFDNSYSIGRRGLFYCFIVI